MKNYSGCEMSGNKVWGNFSLANIQKLVPRVDELNSGITQQLVPGTETTACEGGGVPAVEAPSVDVQSRLSTNHL